MGSTDSERKKKGKRACGSRAVCRVDECGADLSGAENYQRRKKVCHVHLNASEVLVENVLQRFCQQCTRFQNLEEFDEENKSCRKSLEDRKKRRRRKASPSATSLSDDTSDRYILMFLEILTDFYSNKSDSTKNQDVFSPLLNRLAQSIGADKNIPEVVSALLENVQQGIMNSVEQLIKALEDMLQKSSAEASLQSSSTMPVEDIYARRSAAPSATTTNAGRIMPNNFDLNVAYADSDDDTQNFVDVHVAANNGNGSHSHVCPLWMEQDVNSSSSPLSSRNFDSESAPSPSRYKERNQTDMIMFKIFKQPSDLPPEWRTQLLDALALAPTDVESYMKPGCIVLTIYLRMPESVWDELCFNMCSHLCRLVEVSSNSFWSTGWVIAKVQNQVAFVYNGRVVIDTTLPYVNSASRISSIKPIAVPVSEKVRFSIKGGNLSPPNSRLLCALEGQYLELEKDSQLLEASSGSHCYSENLRVMNYSCSIPGIIGRGFIEVEDNALGSDFFPFIVAESDICSEIRKLEGILESTEVDATDARLKAIDFIQEMGWLLRRSHLRMLLESGHSDAWEEDVFHLDRLKWLMEFSLEQEWCAVVKKLLDILFSGMVCTGEHESLVAAVADMSILHRAVRKNSRPLVEVLLKYVHEGKSSESMEGADYFFKPNAKEPSGLTPLHIAAGRDDTEGVLDALTDDPEMVGIEAWTTAKDSTGASPEDYARLRGHYSYINLVQQKISKKKPTSHVILEIPNSPSKSSPTKIGEDTKLSMEIGQGPCNICDQKLVNRTVNTHLEWKPAVFSILGIACVCACIAILIKSCPEVFYTFRHFRWEHLEHRSR